MADDEVFRLYMRAGEKAARMTFKATSYAIKETQKWLNDIEKRCKNSLITEEQAYREQMDLDSRILDLHLQKAQQRGVLSADEVLDVKEEIEKLKAVKGVNDCRESSYIVRDILNRYKKADMLYKSGTPLKEAFKDIKKAPMKARIRAQKFFKEVMQVAQRMQTQLREAAAERCR